MNPNTRKKSGKKRPITIILNIAGEGKEVFHSEVELEEYEDDEEIEDYEDDEDLDNEDDDEDEDFDDEDEEG